MALPILALLKPIALKLIMAKVSEKTGKVELAPKKEVGVTSTVYLVVVGALLTYLSSKGYIDPALYELILTIATDPTIAAEIEEAL